MNLYKISRGKLLLLLEEIHFLSHFTSKTHSCVKMWEYTIFNFPDESSLHDYTPESEIT